MVLLVEGLDDALFYSEYFVEENVFLFVMNGHEWMTQVLGDLSSVFPNQLAAIKDADFNHLDNSYSVHQNMFVTDCHDWEMTIVSADRTSRIAARYGICDDESGILHEEVMRELQNYSYVRWANSWIPAKEDRVRFLDDAENMRGKTLAEVVTIVNGNQKENRWIDPIYVDSFKKQHPNADLRQLNNGHDYMRMLRKLISEKSKKNIRNGEIPEAYVRLFTGADFSLTRLAHNLRSYSFTKEVLL